MDTGSSFLRKSSFLAAGAGFGILIALSIEVSGHRWWAFLMLLACAIAPTGLSAAWLVRLRNRAAVSTMSSSTKAACLLGLIGVTFAIEWALGANPRDYAYLPLLPPVLLAAALFGFGHGVLAVVICTITADYLFALPEFDFAITELEDLIGLSLFAVLGAALAFIVEQFVPE